MTTNQSNTPYEPWRVRPWRKHAERRRAREKALAKAFAKGRAMSVIDAAHMIWEPIFGADYIGPRSEWENQVLMAGAAHRDHHKVDRHDDRRDAQLERLRRLLQEWRVVKTEGNLQYVLRASLRRALKAALEAHGPRGLAVARPIAPPEPGAAEAIDVPEGPRAPIVPWAAPAAAQSDPIATEADEPTATPPCPSQDATKGRRKRPAEGAALSPRDEEIWQSALDLNMDLNKHGAVSTAARKIAKERKEDVSSVRRSINRGKAAQRRK